MLKTVGLSVKLSGIDIVKNVNISVKRGQFVGLIGPNGSGKSTLLKAIYRVIKPAGGDIFIGGQNIKGQSLRQTARCMSVVSQITTINFDFTVEQMVLMGRTPYKRIMDRNTSSDRDIVQRALQRVGLVGFDKRSFSTLSGGERQRVMLARAFAQQTDMMILDEPTNHLDIQHQLDFFNSIKQEKTTVFAALHDLNLTAIYCDYVYVLDKGRIVANGPVTKTLTADILKSVFSVNCRIHHDGDGRVHVQYLP